MAPAVALIDGFEFRQQITLARGEIDRRFHHHVTEQVAIGCAAHASDAFAAQPEHLAALRLGWNPELSGTVQRGNLDFSTERSRGKADWHFAVQIAVIAGKNRVFLDVDDYI